MVVESIVIDKNGHTDETISPLRSPTSPITTQQSTATKGKRAQIKREMSLNGETDDPVEATFEDVSAAAYRIKSGVRRTPCEKSPRLSALLGMEVFCKRDYMQVTGSFKERGARNTLLMLSKEQKRLGVIAASAGNHALALAYHGQQLGIPVTVCMPINAPITKVSQCRKYGATVHMIGADLIEAKEFGSTVAAKERLAYINGYDHPDILSGQGTCGLEIADQVDDIDAVVIPVGGGGLIAGMAVALKTLHPKIQIIGVESERCASFKAALEANGPIKIQADQSLTLADGLCVSKVGLNAFHTAKPYVDKVIQVSEAYIAIAVLRLIEEEKCVVEGAGATGLAAALAGLLPELKGKRHQTIIGNHTALAGLLPELQGKRVVFPLCGGNIDSTVLGRVIERGLAADGRLLRVTVVVSDRPGGIAELTKFLAEHGASVKDIFHERAWLKTSVFTVEIKVVIEVKDYEHGQTLKKAIQEKYENVIWSSQAIEDGK